MFDTVGSLLRAGSDDPAKTTSGGAAGSVYKGAFEKEGRVAALYIAGEVFGALGDHVMSLFNELVTTTLAVAKSTYHPVILRYHALLCLKKVLSKGANSINDQSGRETLRSLRSGLADKAGAVVRGYADCILVLALQTELVSSRNEVETIVTAGLKALETADFPTKRSVSEMLGAVLALTQQEMAPPAASAKDKKKSKKADGQADSDDDASPLPSSAGSGSFRQMMNPAAMFDQLANIYFRQPYQRKLQVAIFDVYSSLFTRLGAEWVNLNYETIFTHLAETLQARLGGSRQRPEYLLLRSGVRILLRQLIGERMLGERGQVEAIQIICNKYLKKWPTLTPGHKPPRKFTMTVALDECAGLLQQLGSTPPQVQDALYEPLIRCLSHPSHSVQMSAALCLRTYCDVSPTNIAPTVTNLIGLVDRSLRNMSTANSSQIVGISRGAHGNARGLAALLNLFPQRPLYASFDASAEVLATSIKLLREAGKHDLHISAVEIQVAWTLLGALMSLGPNFVRPHLGQLLNLWKNALPKPTAKDASNSGRTDAEWGFLLHVRECTIGCILSFLTHNASELVNLDTARRIVALLSHMLAFADGFSSQYQHLMQEQTPGVYGGGLNLLDREFLLRRRLMQCFAKLSGNPAMEPLESGLLMVALRAFAEVDRYVGSATAAAIAASSGTFISVWTVPDGYAFGVSSLLEADSCKVCEAAPASHQFRLNRDSLEVSLDDLQNFPIMVAAEHDLSLVYLGGATEVVPAITAVVDSSIEVFAQLFPFQPRNTQLAALDTMASYLRHPRLERNPGRKAAVQANIAAALLGAVRVASIPTTRVSEGWSNDKLGAQFKDLTQKGLISEDSHIRVAASEAYGRYAALAGSRLLSGQVQYLVDQVVSNRDPDTRAGCASAFGAIYTYLGGLSAGPLTKTIVNVLMSLSSDPHPTVHYHALRALRRVVEAASLSYTPYVASTLGMLVKLYMSDTHEPEGGSVGSVNIRGDLPAHQAMCRVIDAIISVLGPDLAEGTKIRELVQALLDEMMIESDEGLIIEATKAYQNFNLFAPESMDKVLWINTLRRHLLSSKRAFKLCAVNALYQVVQKEAAAISKVGGDLLAEEFFAQIDKDPSLDGVREVTLSWLRQTAAVNPRAWVDLCQRIISQGKSAAPPPPKPKGPAVGSHLAALQDEESASLGISEGSGFTEANGSQWRTRCFALDCVHEVFTTLKAAGRLEHFRNPPTDNAFLMSNRVGDLIKMAFSASTAPNVEIRQSGLVLLRDIIENFKVTPDPDFPEALMLEQHQAPISAALMPAFSGDSAPEVVASAIQVCASFVGSGIVKDTNGMGRILKQLVFALTSSQEASMTSLGDVQNLTPNASVMLKIAVSTAWAELYLNRSQHDFLLDVVNPHVKVLVPYWVALLKEYARLRSTDAESAALGQTSSGNVTFASAIDPQYAGLSREVVLPYYEASWYRVLHAFSRVMHSEDNALLEKAETEPAPFFFAIYGLAFEVLSSTIAWKDALREAQVKRVALQALQGLSHAKYAGSALLDEGLFGELSALCHRMVMTETAVVQIGVMEMLSALIGSYGERLQNREMLDKNLRLALHVLKTAPKSPGNAPEKAKLLNFAFSAVLEISALHAEALRNNLLGILLHLYSGEEGGAKFLTRIRS